MSDKPIDEIIKQQGDEAEAMKFPCHHPVKAMGPNTEKFRQEILFLVQKHHDAVDTSDMRWSLSKTGKYQSVTIDLTAQSREQLESIYAELKSHTDVKWTL